MVVRSSTPPSLEPLCNSTTLNNILQNRPSFCTHYIFDNNNIDTVCYCLDFTDAGSFYCDVTNPRNRSLRIFLPELKGHCDNRRIYINASSIINLQKECCGNYCGVRLFDYYTDYRFDLGA